MKKSILLAVVILAAGCKMGPTYTTPKTNPPEKFRFQVNTDSVNLRWWTMFNDATLDTLVHTALLENQDIKIAAERIEQSRATLGIQKSELLPKFDLGGQAVRGNYQGLVLPEAVNTIAGGVSVNWELDFWGKYRRLSESAKAELMASTYGLRSVQIGLIAEVSRTYFFLLDYQSRLEISRKTLVSRNNGLEIIRQRFEKGIVPEIDLNQAQMQSAIAASAVPYYERQLRQTENALSVLLGRTPSQIALVRKLEEHTSPPDLPTGLPADLLANRPDIVQSAQLVQAQNARIGAAQAQRLPAISLTGLIGVTGGDNISGLSSTGMAWRGGATLLGPLFYWGQYKKRVEIEKSKTEQTQQQYRKTVINAFREVDDALISVRTLKEEMAARQQQEDAAVNAAKLSQLRYDKGITSYLEVLETQRQSFEAELIMAETRQQLLNSYIQLYKALGGGWLNEQESQNK